MSNFYLQILNESENVVTLIGQEFSCISKWTLDRAISNGTQGSCHPRGWSALDIVIHMASSLNKLSEVWKENKNTRRADPILRGLVKWNRRKKFSYYSMVGNVRWEAEGTGASNSCVFMSLNQF